MKITVNQVFSDSDTTTTKLTVEEDEDNSQQELTRGLVMVIWLEGGWEFEMDDRTQAHTLENRNLLKRVRECSCLPFCTKAILLRRLCGTRR